MTAPTTPGLNIDDELSKKLKFVLMAVLIYRVGAPELPRQAPSGRHSSAQFNPSIPGSHQLDDAAYQRF